MKINKKETSASRKKSILLIGVIALVICAVVASLAYFYATSKQDVNQNLQADSSQTNENGNQVTPNKENSNSGILPSKATNPSTSSPESLESLEVSITAANQTNSVLQIRTLINSVTQGECTLSLSRAGNVLITRSAPTQPLASTSTCSGFDIDTSNLEAGEWEATIEVKTDTQTGRVTQGVTVK